MNTTAIETRYAGCRFRSRLEARWAVFFDHLGIAWEYEPQGFVVNGRPYLPDFRLVVSRTWVEVKGDEVAVDVALMAAAASCLPSAQEGFPTLVLLGPIPEPPSPSTGWAWIGLSGGLDEPLDEHWSFIPTTVAPTDTSTATNYTAGGPLLVPTLDMANATDASAYQAARAARFEHGESGTASSNDMRLVDQVRAEITRYDPTTAEGRVVALRRVGPIAARIADHVERRRTAQYIADYTGLPIDPVMRVVTAGGRG